MGPYIHNQPTHRQRHIAKREKYFGVPTLNSPVEDVMFVCRRRRLEPRFVNAGYTVCLNRERTMICGAPENMKKM